MIHLASAMHFAGFWSVIGTMWAVEDRESNKITRCFIGTWRTSLVVWIILEQRLR